MSTSTSRSFTAYYIYLTCVFGFGFIVIVISYLHHSGYVSVQFAYPDPAMYNHPIKIFEDLTTKSYEKGNRTKGTHKIRSEKTRSIHDNIQAERKSRVRDYCNKHATMMNVSSSVPRKLIQYNNTVMFCRINKCASTFCLGTLRNIFNCKPDSCDGVEVSRHTEIDGVTKIQKSMEDKFSFFFVREPYRRLFSTYSNKFYLPKEYWAPVGPDTVRLYRDNPSKVSLHYGHDITFEELLRYTVDRFENNQRLDVHLRPIYKLCNPCSFDFSYIGKLETLDDDWNKMFTSWKQTKLINVSFNSSVHEFYPVTNLPEVYHFYQSIEALKDSGISIHSLYLRTWTYFQISGRISKHKDLPYSADEVEHVSYREFHHTVRDAIDDSKQFGDTVKAQKDEALKQAYAAIPRDLLEKVRNMLLSDCSMFGYDDRPEWLFGDELLHFKTDYDYFRGI